MPPNYYEMLGVKPPKNRRQENLLDPLDLLETNSAPAVDSPSRAQPSVPPLFPRRDRLHANLRLAVGLIFNILMGYFAQRASHSGGGVFGEIMPSVVLCGAVTVLLPVFFLGGPAQRMIAIGLLFSPMFLLGAGILGAIFGCAVGSH